MNILDLQYDFDVTVENGEEEYGETLYILSFKYMPEYIVGTPTEFTEKYFLTESDYRNLEDGLTDLLHKMAMFRKKQS